ncbi:tripartite tricarboxylate transporter TctB family protein [Spiribacter halobius]|uniref:tripartite tricarboxylate transporter TctB family protein n=1 Tax=Sediminicurvatus halobius TaxID=2182432 RepID=UPI001304CEC0|nr:tripartite tricarboxylate transporter TctB family protein [Spiribacter halobius]UEX77402.1 tripartite tricarboxylate transporter TctB family protein [Spiribacter halobius]
MSASTRELLKISSEAAVWLGIAAFAWIQTYEFAGQDMIFRWGAAIWPRAVIVALVLGAAVQFLGRLMAWQQRRGREAAASPATPRVRDWRATARTGAMLVVPLVYLYLLPRMGYFVTTPFFIGLLVHIYGIRQPAKVVGIALAVYAALLLFFTTLLFVPLPTGYWPGFYEFNTWFAELVS